MFLLLFIISLSCNTIIYNSHHSSTVTTPLISKNKNYDSISSKSFEEIYTLNGSTSPFNQPITPASKPLAITIDQVEPKSPGYPNNIHIDIYNSPTEQTKSSIFSEGSADSSEDTMFENHSQHYLQLDNQQDFNPIHKICLKIIFGCAAVAVVVIAIKSIVNHFK